MLHVIEYMYLRFPRICQTDLQDCSAPTFSKIDFRNGEMSENMFKNDSGVFLELFEVILVYPNLKTIGLGDPGHVLQVRKP